MRLTYINIFMVGIPVAAGLLGLIFPWFLMIALVFPIVTGSFQVATAIYMLVDYGLRNMYLNIYLIIAICFFALWHLTYWDWIWIMPPALALYFSVLLFKLQKIKDNEP